MNITFVNIVLILLALAVLGALTLWLAFLYTIRDPKRTPPDEAGIIVAPADGRIKYITRIEDGQIPFSEKHGRLIPITDSTKEFPVQSGYLIGIWMSFLVVHVQRAPLDGDVERQYYHACGKFLDPQFDKNADYENERNIIAIRNPVFPGPVLVIQIASIMVRRIVSYVKEGQKLSIGDKLGLIRMGSQVDIVLPDTPTLNLEIKKGDRVYAGESVIARFEPHGD